MLRNIAKVGGGVVVVGSVAAYGWAVNTMGSDAVSRMAEFEVVAAPMAIAYKWEEAKCEKLPLTVPWFFSPVPQAEQDKRYDALHKKYVASERSDECRATPNEK